MAFSLSRQPATFRQPRLYLGTHVFGRAIADSAFDAFPDRGFQYFESCFFGFRHSQTRTYGFAGGLEALLRFQALPAGSGVRPLVDREPLVSILVQLVQCDAAEHQRVQGGELRE